MNKIAKVLIIEDEPFVRSNIQQLLQLADFETVVAQDGNEGVELAKKEIPDLIICDVMMPKMNGYEVLEALREEQSTENIPLIFLTARADRSDFRQGMDLGADDYVAKPFTVDELLNAVNTRLEKRAAVQRHTERQLEELRSNITFSLPHELRTPLNGIMVSADLLKQLKDNIEAEELEEIAESILISAQRLNHLTQNFLLYAELEIISSNPEKVKFLRHPTAVSSVQPLLTELGMIKAQELEREADLKLDLKDAKVNMEERYLSKILDELIDNAFKFSPAGSWVEISSKIAEEMCIIEVRDRGRGMNPEQVEKIGAYMQFQRRMYEQQGSGFGLTLVKRIIELHGGKLNIKSVENQYTTVQISLPTIEDLQEYDFL